MSQAFLFTLTTFVIHVLHRIFYIETDLGGSNLLDSFSGRFFLLEYLKKQEIKNVTFNFPVVQIQKYTYIST